VVIRLRQNVDECLPLEQINPHIRQTIPTLTLHPAAIDPGRFHANQIHFRICLRFLQKPFHSAVVVDSHDPERLGGFAVHR
jgi:hypothetical protein